VANVWTNRLLEPATGTTIPLVAERHEVMAFEAPRPYLPTYPVLKDMASASMVYARCYGRSQLLASPGLAGDATDPDEGQADVPLDTIAALGEQVAARLESFEEAGVASTWTGLYDVTPDWNPVLGPLPGWDGLQVGFGFSGHGFKLSPAVGRLLAQSALGLPTDVPLAPYRFERFDEGALLVGRYGKGAVS
jgi:glycine/D-amino acid oxidase-like deaminating enzyme